MIPIDTMIPVTPARVSVAPWNSLNRPNTRKSRDPKMLSPMTAMRPERPVVEDEQDRHHHEGADAGDQSGAKGVLAERGRNRLDPFPLQRGGQGAVPQDGRQVLGLGLGVLRSADGDVDLVGLERGARRHRLGDGRGRVDLPVDHDRHLASRVARRVLGEDGGGVLELDRAVRRELGVDDDPSVEAADEPCLGPGQVLAGEERRADVVDQPVASLQVPLGVHVVDDGEPGLRVHVVRDDRSNRGRGGRRLVGTGGGRGAVARAWSTSPPERWSWWCPAAPRAAAGCRW